MLLSIDIAIKKSGLDELSDIDVVLTAGGSSLILCVQNYLYDRFADALHPKAGRTEKLTSIVRGLSIVGCRETDILEDVVDNSYGFWDVSRNMFQPVIRAGTKVADTAFNKVHKSGIFIPIKKQDPDANLLYIKIVQSNKNGYDDLGTIEVRGADSNSYKVFMSIDKKQGTLSVYLYDNENRVWLDDQGKVATADCRYRLKKI